MSAVYHENMEKYVGVGREVHHYLFFIEILTVQLRSYILRNEMM